MFVNFISVVDSFKYRRGNRSRGQRKKEKSRDKKKQKKRKFFKVKKVL